MLARQKQQYESYLRVQDFLGQSAPPQPPANYAVQKATLDDVIAKLGSHSGDQSGGQKESRADAQRQRVSRRSLREDHLAPIAKIARALLKDAPGIERALKMPNPQIATLRLVGEATGMRTSVTPYAQVFIDNGRPADFLAQLDAAIEGLRGTVMGKARNVGRHVGAKAGMGQELARGRRAVDLLDAMVTSAFKGDADLLAKWRVAKRVQATPGGSSAPQAVAAPAPVIVTPEVKAAA